MLTRAERKLVLGVGAALALYLDRESGAKGWTSPVTDGDREFLFSLVDASPTDPIASTLIKLLREVVEPPPAEKA